MIPVNTEQYMREHLGCMFSIAEDGIHTRKWAKEERLQEKHLKDPRINCCQELPTEITLESDYTGEEEYKNKENQDYAEKKLQELGVGYYISSHKGKSDYIRFRFKTNQEITSALRLEIIRYLAKPDLEFDENFKSIKFVRPIPNRYHWKHSYEIEKIIKVVNGEDFDIDSVGIKEPVKPQRPSVSGSMGWMQPKGWALSINIRKLAERYKLENCPDCSSYLVFDETRGFYRCNSCGLFGGLKKFATLILNKRRSATQ